MKKLILSLCFAAFLSAGLVSCSDDAAEVAPKYSGASTNAVSQSNDPATTGPKKP